MRKIHIFLFVFAMITVLTACAANAENPLQTTEPTVAQVSESTQTDELEIFATIEAKNCFYDAGFIELIAGTSEALEYTFTSENSDSVEWAVYILDEAFDDSFRYIKQVTDPVLTGDGTIFIEQGQYVYVYCSANEFTTGVVDENACLNVTVK